MHHPTRHPAHQDWLEVGTAGQDDAVKWRGSTIRSAEAEADGRVESFKRWYEFSRARYLDAAAHRQNDESAVAN